MVVVRVLNMEHHLACRWAHLMLVGGNADGGLKEKLLRYLEEQAQRLYTRPYLPRGCAERTLLLLLALYQVKHVGQMPVQCNRGPLPRRALQPLLLGLRAFMHDTITSRSVKGSVGWGNSELAPISKGWIPICRDVPPYSGEGEIYYVELPNVTYCC
jgi:hypothetical protein